MTELYSPTIGDIRIIATTRDYCHSWTFISELGDCLECALTYDVWKDYGDQVVAAASPCGANATPSPSSALNTVVSTGSAAASTTVIGTASSTVTPTTTQSSTATTGSPGIVSSATRTVSVFQDLSGPQGRLLTLSLIIRGPLSLLHLPPHHIPLEPHQI